MGATTEAEQRGGGGTLRRLTCFLASALDVRFAFVWAFCGSEAPPARRVALWLARDYGLRSEFAETDVRQCLAPARGSDLLGTLRAAWPHDPELAGLSNGDAVSLALVGRDGSSLGYLGILDPEGRRTLPGPERLRPLARPAVAEVERWGAARRSSPSTPVVRGPHR